MELSGHDESMWSVLDEPEAAGFSVDGVPDGWARADDLRIDGLPAVVWLPNPTLESGFTPNAVFAAWTTHLTGRRLDDLLSALRTPESTDGLILMDPPAVLTDTADSYTQLADALIQSPFGPLASRVWHSVRREQGDRVSMGRLTVTVARPDSHLLDKFDLRS